MMFLKTSDTDACDHTVLKNQDFDFMMLQQSVVDLQIENQKLKTQIKLLQK